MGLRADLDTIKKRCIYILTVNDVIIYIGTTCNPKTRYYGHLKRIKTDNALLYRYLRAVNIIPKIVVIKKLVTSYNEAEKYEIELIKKHSDTVLNFYNNPNKERYNRLNNMY